MHVLVIFCQLYRHSSGYDAYVQQQALTYFTPQSCWKSMIHKLEAELQFTIPKAETPKL